METFDERHNVITLSNGRRVFPENEPETEPTRAEVQAAIKEWIDTPIGREPPVSNG